MQIMIQWVKLTDDDCDDEDIDHNSTLCRRHSQQQDSINVINNVTSNILMEANAYVAFNVGWALF